MDAPFLRSREENGGGRRHLRKERAVVSADDVVVVVDDVSAPSGSSGFLNDMRFFDRASSSVHAVIKGNFHWRNMAQTQFARGRKRRHRHS